MGPERIDELVSEFCDGFMKQGDLSDHEINAKLQELRIYMQYDLPNMRLGEEAVKGGPLLDVLSVTFRPKSDISPHHDNAQPPWEIYGVILVKFADNDATCRLYHQPLDDPQIISTLDSNGASFLDIFNSTFYGFFPSVTFNVVLFEKVRNLILLRSSFHLDYADFSEFDKVQYKELESDVATVCFKYITRRAALIARVNVVLVNGEGESENMNVSGTVTASCQYHVSECSSFHSHSERGCSCAPLFAVEDEEEEEEGVEISVGKPMELTKCLLAVPVYSVLVIELNLKSGGGYYVEDAVEFCAPQIWWGSSGYEKNVEGRNGLLFKVRVEWCHECLYRMVLQELQDEIVEESDYESDEDIIEEEGDNQSDDNIFRDSGEDIFDESDSGLDNADESSQESDDEGGEMDQIQSTEVGLNHDDDGCIDHCNEVCETQTVVKVPLYDRPLNKRYLEDELMEIYSVFVGADDDCTYNIYGKIYTGNKNEIRFLYDKDQSQTETFARGKTLALLQGDERFIGGGALSLTVDLKDSNGHEFCKGWFDWDVYNHKPTWLNTRLCSVIKGEIGFVALHYSLFTNAVQCTVKAFLSPVSPCGDMSMNGTLIGEYNNHDYSTLYEREFYRTVLFRRSDTETMILPLQGEEIPTQIWSYVDPSAVCMSIPLSKSIVCVPTDSYLRIQVNLLVGSQTPNIRTQSLSDTLEFHIGRDTCWRIQSQDFHVYILAEWGRVIGPSTK